MKIMLIMHGLPGSGKSTLSKLLSAIFGFKYVSTDDVRLEQTDTPQIFDISPLQRFVIYDQTLKKAESILANNESVIVDGTFTVRILREAAYYTAKKSNAQPYIIDCYCNNYGLVQKRFEQRKKAPIFQQWADINSYHVKYSNHHPLINEAIPKSLEPVPIIRYNSEIGKANIFYSDGSTIIQQLVEAINEPVKVKA